MAKPQKAQTWDPREYYVVHVPQIGRWIRVHKTSVNALGVPPPANASGRPAGPRPTGTGNWLAVIE